MSNEPRLMTVLHGHGSNGGVAGSLAARIDPKRRFQHVAPNGPVGLGPASFAWFDGETASGLAQAAVGLADIVTSSVLVGWSQGGAAALATVAVAGAPSIDALVLVSGFLIDAPGVDYDLSVLRGIPVLVQHGRQDEVVPVFFAEDLAQSLIDAGALVDLKLYDDVGHLLASDADDDARSWLTELAER